jgi:hypothetical protein
LYMSDLLSILGGIISYPGVKSPNWNSPSEAEKAPKGLDPAPEASS